MSGLSKICYTEEIKKKMIEAGKEEKDFYMSFDEMIFELYSVKGKIEFGKRIQLHALIKDISLTQLKDMLAKHHYTKDASTKWLLDINTIPDEVKHLLLEYFKLEDELTLEERNLYFRAYDKYDKLLSKTRGSLSKDEKKKRKAYIEKCKTDFEVKRAEISRSCEEQEESYYLEEIKEKFALLSKKEKYMLVNYFHVYVATPFESFNFAIKYAKLNTVGKWMLGRAMRKLICEKGEAILRTEEISTMEEMLKVDMDSLHSVIENSDENALETLFYEKLNHTNFNEKLFFKNMEIYPQIEANEWKIINAFVKLGEFYDPEIQTFSYSQKKIDYFVEMLSEDFCLDIKF